jgi:acetyltransferase
VSKRPSGGAGWPYLRRLAGRPNRNVENIRIRPVRTTDESALIAFYADLSADSRRARFLGCSRGLDPVTAHGLCRCVNVDEAGFVAERVGLNGCRIVGHVSLTDAGDGALEIGIAVADEVQGRGLGRRLFATAIAWAEHGGVARLVASAFTDNWRVLRLLRSSGHATLVRDTGGGVSGISIDLADHADQQRAA